MASVFSLLGHPFGVPESRAGALEQVLEQSRELGFLGPGPAMFHVEHALLTVSLAPGTGRLLDLGSGGGVPGLVVAVARPDLHVVLLDSMSKRCAFLAEAVRKLGIAEQVVVELGRAEVLARRPDLRSQFDVVTARSFGPPSATAECAAGFLCLDGRLLVSEPPEDDPGRWPTDPLRTLGLVLVDRHSDNRSTVAELRQAALAGPDVPRRDGVPVKRPRW